MKKYLLIALAVTGLATTQSQAQAITGYTLSAKTAAGVAKAKDTTVNTDTTYLVPTTNGDGSIQYNGDVIVQFTNTQLSGTTGGSIVLQGSMTGVHSLTGDWVALHNSSTQYAGAADTVTVSGTTKGYYVVPSNLFKYVRLRYISSGTQTSLLTGTLYVRRE